jgi:hypothetical protein
MKPHTTPTWTDDQLAALREQHPDWDFWHVANATGLTPGTFCARPSGAMIATCHGDTPDHLTHAITDYETRLPEHTADARAGLQAPGLQDDRRNVLRQQLNGMTRLDDAITARTTADADGPGP